MKKVGFAVVVTTTALFLNACYSFEPRAPERAFNLSDLLLDQDSIPVTWQVFERFVPVGDELCATECSAIRFGPQTGTDNHAVATNFIYRYKSSGIAQRTFDNVYLVQQKSLSAVAEWSYQSERAQQAHFGCRMTAGDTGQICMWAARYDEFIVVLSARMVPGELSIAQLLPIVEELDGRITAQLTLEPE